MRFIRSDELLVIRRGEYGRTDFIQIVPRDMEFGSHDGKYEIRHLGSISSVFMDDDIVKEEEKIKNEG